MSESVASYRVGREGLQSVASYAPRRVKLAGSDAQDPTCRKCLAAGVPFPTPGRPLPERSS